jgi:protein-disulfide isomerase
LLKVLLRGSALAAFLVGFAALPAAAGTLSAPDRLDRNAALTAPRQLAEAEKKKEAEKKGDEKKPMEKAGDGPMVGLVPLKVALADKVIGKKDAPITILAFESLSCPHCRAFHSGAWPTIKKEYIDTGKAKIIFHTVFGGVRAQFATMLARCVPDDRHFAMVSLLFRNQEKWTRANNANELFAHLKPIARLVGMNDAQFKSCMESKELYRGLSRMRDELDAKYKIESTPTFVINGKRLIGAQPFSEFDKLMKPMIKAELSGAK